MTEAKLSPVWVVASIFPHCHKILSENYDRKEVPIEFREPINVCYWSAQLLPLRLTCKPGRGRITTGTMMLHMLKALGMHPQQKRYRQHRNRREGKADTLLNFGPITTLCLSLQDAPVLGATRHSPSKPHPNAPSGAYLTFMPPPPPPPREVCSQVVQRGLQYRKQSAPQWPWWTIGTFLPQKRDGLVTCGRAPVGLMQNSGCMHSCCRRADPRDP